MKITFKDRLFNPVYTPFYKNQSRFMVYYGGGGSGKSHWIAQSYLLHMIKEKGHRFLFVRKTFKSIRGSQFRLMCDLIKEYNLEKFFDIGKIEMTIRCLITGSEIMCYGLDDVEKLKSLTGITGIWIEEATEITEADFTQLNLRMRGLSQYHKQIVLSFNPVSKQNWVYKYFFEGKIPDGVKTYTNPVQNTTILKTTYKDNKFLDKEYIKTLEQLISENPAYHTIYVLGDWGALDDLVFTRPFQKIPLSAFPQRPQETIFGLDFGYNHPTALVRADIYDMNIFLRKYIYESKLTNTDLINRMRELEVPDDCTIYADWAEPARIAEIGDAGYSIVPADKSINDGIDFIKSQWNNIFIDIADIEFENERGAYSYKKDQFGEPTDSPIPLKDDLLCATRYALYSHSLVPEFKMFFAGE